VDISEGCNDVDNRRDVNSEQQRPSKHTNYSCGTLCTMQAAAN